jgi:hypothetical protein
MTDQPVPKCIESRKLPDGRGGVFLDGELILVCDTEEQSDSAAIYAVRRMVIDGLVKSTGQAYKDDQPMELFDMSIR